ncbi:hypothetical protein Bca52824_057207 [Brassica carinata]|uniref:Uncharacterized protein n=1 Tax=Brassica carinata TaxID=52824 RepID=A0A8X7UDG4_BRACI|nr:hypothetical protein Bca52824_057207 [Brassica carinata]
MEPFLRMVPYLLVECAATNEIRVKYGLEPYTYETAERCTRPTMVIVALCAVKYIECHALGVSFDPKDFARCSEENEG